MDNLWEDKKVDIDLGCVRRRTLQTVSISFSVKQKSLMVYYFFPWVMMCKTSLIYVNHGNKHEVQCVNFVRPGVCWQFLPKKRCQEETCQNMSNPPCYTMYLACNTNRTDFCSVLFDLYLDLQLFSIYWIHMMTNGVKALSVALWWLSVSYQRTLAAFLKLYSPIYAISEQ